MRRNFCFLGFKQMTANEAWCFIGSFAVIAGMPFSGQMT